MNNILNVDNWLERDFTIENIIKLHKKCSECRIGIPYGVFKLLVYNNPKHLICLKYLFDNFKGIKIENINPRFLNNIENPMLLQELVRRFENSANLLFKIALKQNNRCSVYYMMHNRDINAENQTLLLSKLIKSNDLKLQTYHLIKLLERIKSCNKYNRGVVIIINVGIEKLIALAVSGIMDYRELLAAFNILYYCCEAKRAMTKKLINFSIKYTIYLPPCVITSENKKLIKLNGLYRGHFDTIVSLLINRGLIKDVARFIVEFL